MIAFRLLLVVILSSSFLACQHLSFTAKAAAKKEVISPLSLQQARDRVHQLDQQRNKIIASLPPLAPKGAFESTAEYDQRIQVYQNPKQVRSLNAEIAKLKESFYKPVGIKSAPTFDFYDPESAVLKLVLDGKSHSFIVPNSSAKKMHDKWTDLTIRWGYNEARTGQDDPPIVLFWNGRSYYETARIYPGDPVSPGGASAPRCPKPTIEPSYSDEARKARVNGIVTLELIIQKDGTVEVSKVVRNLGYGLDDEAMKVARKMKCVPGQLNGQPVPSRVKMDINFHLY